jgi:glutathione synthase/RimK-type ligase-like ATP-grasp enzyme
MITILGSRKSRPTAKLLSEALSANYTENRIPDSEDMFTIRYGNSYTADPEGRILNKQNAVKTAKNKPTAKSLLQEKNIPTPKLISFEDAIAGNVEFPVIVRRNNHFKGKFFNVCNNPRDIRRFSPSNHYIQEMVNKKDEYRLFILNDRIIEANIKRCPENQSTPMVRNKENGCFFARVRVADLDRELKNAARSAIREIGLDFGAVDCATIQESPGITIFEVNSAPGLIPRKIELLKTKLEEII